MAYDFLGLVNDINKKVNEVELTSANFASQGGVYGAHKDAVNSALREINQQEFNWPFNLVVYDETLVPGQVRYAYQSDAKAADLQSFRIQRDDTLGNSSKKLKPILYEDYLDNFVDHEYNTSSDAARDIPRLVFKTQAQEYGIIPPPDKAYTLTYEYFSLPTDLVNATDVPTVPEAFRYSVVLEGAMYHAYLFRGDVEGAQLSQQKFRQGLTAMRKIYINRYLEARDSRIHRYNKSVLGFY